MSIKDMSIKVEPLKKKDKKQTLEFFYKTITDSFKTEGLFELGMTDTCKHEINNQEKRISSSIRSGTPYYLLAKDKNLVVGTIAFGRPGKAIEKAFLQLNKSSNGVVEIFSSFVLPEYQRKGIGSLLFKAVKEEIVKRGYRLFAVNTGYKKGLKFWGEKLGKPSITLKKYYYPIDCYVWIKEIR